MKKIYLLIIGVLASVSVNAQTPSVSVDLTDRLLVNPDFEFKDITDSIGNVTRTPYDSSNGDLFRGCPTGWSVDGTYSGTSWGISNGAKGIHGNAQCWISFTKFDDGFKFYQTIPSDKLEPGIYKVSCLMYVEKDLYGACCLFANNSVEYWGHEDQYAQNQTEGDETITYANYAGGCNETDTRWLLPMVVYVKVEAGQDLSLGIRTSSKMGGDGKIKNNAGRFQVDNFRIEKVLSAQPGPDDLTASLLKNPEFESLSDTEVLSSVDYKKYISQPYGWEVDNPTSMMGYAPGYLQNYHGKGVVQVNDSLDYIEDFRLYQTIPASDITPGLYRVYCRFWQYKHNGDCLFGTGRLYGDNEDKTYSMYYGNKNDYCDNLDEEETYSFGNYRGDYSGWEWHRLFNVFIDVPVYENKGLTVGVRTSSLNQDGDYDYPKNGYWRISKSLTLPSVSGWFMVDDFGLFRESGNPVTLSEDVTNTINASKYNKVTLNKKFTNNQWNAICLPFSLNSTDISTIFGKGTQVAQFSKASGQDVYFELTDSIVAGKAYIVKPTDVLPSPIILDDVSFTATEPANAEGAVGFKGVYSLTTLDVSSQIISAEGKTEAASQVNAFGAYFTGVDGANIKIGTTGINNVDANQPKTDVEYNLAGQRVNKSYKGIRVSKNKKYIH